MTPLKPTYALILDGLAGIRAANATKERGRKGVLRAGNTGLLMPDGRVVGKCARQTYLRLIGVDAEQQDASREMMFSAGRTNETSWLDLLLSAGIPRESI